MKSESIVIDLLRRALSCEPLESLEAVDWERVKELSLRHRVAPLLSAVVSDDIPEDMRRWAHSATIACAQRSIQAKRALVHVKESFDAAGVRGLLFKGVALQEWVYGGLVRASADIDLLVEPHKAAAAARELRCLGFHKMKSYGAHVHPYDPIGVWQDRHGNSIDLHAHAIEPYVYPFPRFSELWEERVELASLAFPLFSPAHHILLLLFHGSKHQWCRLSWIVDVAVASQRLEESVWREVYELGQRLNSLRAMSVGLLLCREFFDVRTAVLAPAALSLDTAGKAIARVYSRRLFEPFPNTLLVKLANSILHLRTMQGVMQKTFYVLARLGHVFRWRSGGWKQLESSHQ